MQLQQSEDDLRLLKLLEIERQKKLKLNVTNIGGFDDYEKVKFKRKRHQSFASGRFDLLQQKLKRSKENESSSD